jgi:Spy/CpxP family protein refolding chaperone
MKRDWLLYLVIFSLALNVGTIGAFTYLRQQDRRKETVVREELPPLPLREIWRRLDLDQEQRRRLREMLPDHRRRVRAWQEELAGKRQELFALLNTEEAPPWPEVQAKIREISELQGKLEEEVVRHLLTMQQQLKPEQRALFVNLLEQRLRPFPFEERRGPRRERRGPPEEQRRGPRPGFPPSPPPGAR